MNRSVSDAFWKHVTKAHGCWAWTGPDDGQGYGMVYWSRQRRGAHRVSWELHNGGGIPKGMCVCHRCDNPGCVNPEHLFLGTHKENDADKRAKGRERNSLPGARNRNAKLTEDVIADIRRRHAAGESQADLSRCFGVDHSVIYKVVHRKSWIHV